jgi:hypothetical protein
MCMNVIMPTAMITMHTDEALSANSARTAFKGKQLLLDLISSSTGTGSRSTSTSRKTENDIPEFNDHVIAILSVAGTTIPSVNDVDIGTKNEVGKTDILVSTESTSSSSSSSATASAAKVDLIEYWKEFFDKWGYGPIQRSDIANVMMEILQKGSIVTY